MKNNTAEQSSSENVLAWDTSDFLFIFIFVCTSAICVLFWWRGFLPFAFLGGDTGLYTAYVAALIDPDAFAKDATLYTEANFSFYRILHLPLIIFMNDIFGHLGTSHLAILAPGIFIQMLGFYLLGRSLFKSKIPAFFLALVSIGKLDMGIDYWGIITDYEPRMLYQTLLPFVLLGIVKFAPNPRTWPWLMAAQGLLVWVHPPSAPPVALATLIGLFCYAPASWTYMRQLKWAFISGLVFLAVCMPFVLSFSGERPHGQLGNYNEMISIYRSVLGSFYLDAIENAKMYMQGAPFRYFLISWAVLGALAAWHCVKGQKRDIAFLIVTLIALVLASISIAWVDQVYSETSQSLPLFYDMIRALRLIVPFMLILAVWGTSLWFEKYGRFVSIISVTLVSLLWLGVNRPGSIPFRATLSCFAKGQVLCADDHMKYDFPVLEYLRTNVPGGSLILPVLSSDHNIDFPQAIRYHSYQPVAYSYKDVNQVLYNNHELLPQWLERRSAITQIQSENDNIKKAAKISALAIKTKADFVVADYIIPDDLVALIGSKTGNFERFTLIRVKPE